MRRPTCLAWLAGLLAFTAQASDGLDGWDKLWRTPDQRGEQLLRQGDAAAAAKTYADPRRKAYAELQAGDNAAAARDFGNFDDSDGQYNRGNALARSGDLQQALKAYDSALARNPDNHDARHNRDLVAQALQQQKNQQQGQQQNQQQDRQQNKGQDQQQSQQQQGQQGQPQSSDQGQTQSGQDTQQDKAQQPQQKSADAKDQQQASAGDKAGKQNDSGNNGDQKQPSPGAPQQNQAQQDTAQNPQQAADDASQARRDAENSLRQTANQKPADQTPAQAQAQTQTGDGAQPQQSSRALSSQTPKTEQQLAQEQWLRQIPDDPSGLLRRKFMIEHQLRQRNQQP